MIEGEQYMQWGACNQAKSSITTEALALVSLPYLPSPLPGCPSPTPCDGRSAARAAQACGSWGLTTCKLLKNW